ncbi:hypothetical protein B0J14DRAFT_568658 [Halenospora varia]|nr:hypothetical protein B0J14DRAFT_568658 [Halenospora varia]
MRQTEHNATLPHIYSYTKPRARHIETPLLKFPLYLLQQDSASPNNTTTSTVPTTLGNLTNTSMSSKSSPSNKSPINKLWHLHPTPIYTFPSTAPGHDYNIPIITTISSSSEPQTLIPSQLTFQALALAVKEEDLEVKRQLRIAAIWKWLKVVREVEVKMMDEIDEEGGLVGVDYLEDKEEDARREDKKNEANAGKDLKTTGTTRKRPSKDNCCQRDEWGEDPETRGHLSACGFYGYRGSQ